LYLYLSLTSFSPATRPFSSPYTAAAGVLNTDNMSILGVTIDYGPYGFMDTFDPRYTPNTTDFSGRRYCYQNQPGAAQ
jgi:uncharacterized protein YdiU (UPF0061 family)